MKLFQWPKICFGLRLDPYHTTNTSSSGFRRSKVLPRLDPTILPQPPPCTNSVAIHTSSPDILLYRLQDAATQKETSLWFTISIFNSNLYDFQHEKGRGFAIGSVLISRLQSKYYWSIMFKQALVAIIKMQSLKPTSIVFAFFWFKKKIVDVVGQLQLDSRVWSFHLDCKHDTRRKSLESPWNVLKRMPQVPIWPTTDNRLNISCEVL